MTTQPAALETNVRRVYDTLVQADSAMTRIDLVVATGVSGADLAWALETLLADEAVWAEGNLVGAI